jgi:outer membrane lipoprotein-sorting protein
MISNGKFLTIKHKTKKQSYVYPLNKTPLFKILDKNNLIYEIKNSKINTNNKESFEFLIKNKNNKIKILFDKKTFNLKGWITEDIYQNKINFKIFNLQINKKVDKNKFKLPELD